MAGKALTVHHPGCHVGVWRFGGAALVLSHHFPVLAEAKNAQVFGFAISALCILILNLGHNVPVTHHMTITGGLAVTQFIPVLGLNPGHGVGLIYLVLGAWVV